MGEAGLSESDRRAMAFADRFEQELVHQGEERRGVAETVEIGWRLLESLPREDLSRLSESAWDWRQGAGEGAS